MTKSPSFCLIFILLVFEMTLLINDPFEVSKPVLRTKAKHPLLTGGFAFNGICGSIAESVTCKIYVPQNSTACLCLLILNY